MIEVGDDSECQRLRSVRRRRALRNFAVDARRRDLLATSRAFFATVVACLAAIILTDGRPDRSVQDWTAHQARMGDALQARTDHLRLYV